MAASNKKDHTTSLTKAGIVSGSLAALYGMPAEAALIHISTPLTTVTTNVGGFSPVFWDVDGAFGSDFRLNSDGSSFVQLNSYGSNGRGFVHESMTGGGFGNPQQVRALPTGALIGPTLSAGYAWGPTNVDTRTILSGGDISSTDAPNLLFGSNFIGFRFDAGGQTRYGWARMELVNNGGNSASLTVAEWAYRDDGLAIRVGQTVPTPDSLALLALGAGGLGAWRRHRKQRSGKNA